MDNFKVIYKILKLLEEAMDQDEFDINLLSPDLLGVTENRRNAILKMLQAEGYITGVLYRNGLSGVKLSKPAITSVPGGKFHDEEGFWNIERN